MKLLQILFLTGALPLVFGLSFAHGLEGPDELFNQANEAYSQEEFEGAINLYQECLQEAESAPLHYNIANAYQKAGDTGRAILHYEKSLALDPANPDVAANLSFVREAAELPARSFGATTRLGQQLPVNVWGWLAAGGFWASLAFLILPRFYGGPRALTRLLFLASLALTLTSGVALLGYHKISNDAVILQADTPLRVAPSPQSNEYGFLQAGELVKIEKRHQSYLFIDNYNDKSGWILAKEIGTIWE